MQRAIDCRYDPVCKFGTTGRRSRLEPVPTVIDTSDWPERRGRLGRLPRVSFGAPHKQAGGGSGALQRIRPRCQSRGASPPPAKLPAAPYAGPTSRTRRTLLGSSRPCHPMSRRSHIMMPAALQYTTRSLHVQLWPPGVQLSWTDPRFFNHNVFI